MKKVLTLVAAAITAATLTAGALAADPVVPFPSASVSQVFVAAHTLTTGGAASNWFAPGSTVVFTAKAVDLKTKKLLLAKDVKYFYVTIPSQPNVKLAFDQKLGWTGKWAVPSSYPQGLVPFKVLVKTQAKRYGMFVQFPVSSAQLTISAAPPAYPAGAPATAVAAEQATQDVALYFDTVNGSRPAGAAPRPAGCTQTNVFRRGEQLVFRGWGTDAKGDVLTTDNVDTAVVSVPGQPDVTLGYGPHGAVGAKVWFWANAWNIPKDYALGDVTLKATFKTDSGTTGTYNIPITIIP